MTNRHSEPVRYGQVVRRVLLDAIAEAQPHYWLRRAAQFRAVGNPDCDDIALACERHAALLAESPADCSALVDLLLVEVAPA